MAVDAFIPVTVLQFNSQKNLTRVQGKVSADIRFATAEPNGNTLLLAEDTDSNKLDYMIIEETPAELLALVEATGDTQNKLQILSVTKLKHGAPNVYSPAREMLLNSSRFVDLVTITVGDGGTRIWYNVELQKTPWIIEVEEELLPSATATSTTTA